MRRRANDAISLERGFLPSVLHLPFFYLTNLYFASVCLSYFVTKSYLAALLLVTFIFGSTLNAYAHGVGADTSLPETIGGRQVAVEASISPNDVLSVEHSAERPTLAIRTLDPGNNATIGGIDYSVTVEKEGMTLLSNQEFRSSDGIMLAKLLPTPNISSSQVTINGQINPGRVMVSKDAPVEIKSMMMVDGGLYKISVTLQSSSAGLHVGQDQTFNLYVSVSSTQDFTVPTSEGNQKISIKTYYAKVSHFDYDGVTNSISFSMPFDWSSSYVAQVPVVHLELEFPKAFKELQVNGYHGYANSKELPRDAVLIDDYSSEDLRLVHFVLNNDRLKSIPVSSGSNSTIDFSLKTSEKPKFPLDLLSTTQKYLWEVSWGPEVIESGIPTTFVMNIQNNQATSGISTLVEHAYFDFVITKDGQEVYRQHMTSSMGTFSNQYTFPAAGSYSIMAQKINGENESAKIDVVVQQGITLIPIIHHPRYNNRQTSLRAV
jgi:hypothetical protein